MGDVVFIEAYRMAIFRGSRDQPKWDQADVAACWRKLQFDRADGAIESLHLEQAKSRSLARIEAMRRLEEKRP